jgi:DNA repair ATPase RecN
MDDRLTIVEGTVQRMDNRLTAVENVVKETSETLHEVKGSVNEIGRRQDTTENRLTSRDSRMALVWATTNATVLAGIIAIVVALFITRGP